MRLNLPVLLFVLLGTVILCGAQTTAPPPAINTTAAPPPTTAPPSTAAPLTNASTDLPTAAPPTNASTDLPTAAPPTNASTDLPTVGPPTAGPSIPAETTTQAGNSTEKPPIATTIPKEEASSDALSPGAIAGITIGSIAGVAAVGGGIFGALKFTGRL